jgi:hypothetical protein
MPALAPWLVKGASRDDDSGLHKLLVLVLLNPMTAFLNAANHTLRFKHQVCTIVWWSLWQMGCRRHCHCGIAGVQLAHRTPSLLMPPICRAPHRSCPSWS